jgi:hypothetical protein
MTKKVEIEQAIVARRARTIHLLRKWALAQLSPDEEYRIAADAAFEEAMAEAPGRR